MERHQNSGGRGINRGGRGQKRGGGEPPFRPQTGGGG